ncbi:MAG: phosphoserine phosphatase SerB [Promethearchaeota archaeon]
MTSQNKEIIITFISRDRPGLIHEITGVIARHGINIIDLEQSVTRGIFSIILVCDLSTSESDPQHCLNLLKEELGGVEDKVGAYLLIDFNKINTKDRNVPERYMKITVLGKDAPGIVANISGIASKYNMNIESSSMISRKDIFAMNLILSYNLNKNIIKAFKDELKDKLDEKKLSIIIQDNYTFKDEKKLVVFDMDSTLIQQECIEMLASDARIKRHIKKITKDAMEGKIDFKEALKKRVKLLTGMPESFLQKVAENLVLTPGAKELVDSLKKMGYKIALISGGFDYFTKIVKEKLDLDYAFGNKLMIEDGKLTGEINENFIIDAKQKAKIQKWLSQIENIPPSNIVSIGDGANDAIMIKNSGLGIGFRPKQILKNVADGIINEENLLGILYAFGDFKKKKYDTI